MLLYVIRLLKICLNVIATLTKKTLRINLIVYMYKMIIINDISYYVFIYHLSMLQI